MADIDTLFKRKKVHSDALLAFGFSAMGSVYRYSKSLVDGQFAMIVTVSEEKELFAELIEHASGESYVLHRISGATGAFVGRVREEYERVLGIIADACFEPDVFKSAGARLVIQYAREKYHNNLEFLWKPSPGNAILRRQDTAKWYAAILTVQKKKLGLSGEGTIEVLDLRMKPQDIAVLVDGKKYLPGYHMNKKHWVTICLDDLTVPIEELFCRIDESFALATK